MIRNKLPGRILIAAAMLLLAGALAGCKDKAESADNKADKTAETVADESTLQEMSSETETEKTVIVNEKPVYLYHMDYSSDTAERISTFHTEWTDEEDIGVFAAIALDSGSFDFMEEYGSEILMQQETWDSVSVPGDYRIGYEVSFKVDGQQKVYTILEPGDVEKEADLFMGDVDLEEVTGYLGIWLYDDYHQDGGFYDHVDQGEYEDDTLLTSIKLRLTPESDRVSDLKLRAFSYSNSLEFDDNGHYNNGYDCEISIME